MNVMCVRDFAIEYIIFAGNGNVAANGTISEEL